MKIKVKEALMVFWKMRLSLLAEGDKLWAEGDKLLAEGDKLLAEGNKLWAEGDKLWAEGVLSLVGNVKMSWTYNTNHGECEVDGVGKFGQE